MNAGWPFARTLRIGVALARDEIVAVLPGDAPSAPWVRPLAPGDPEGEWPELMRALGELREAAARRVPAFHGALHVALVPPLAQLRRVALSGLRVDEARNVLRREPPRYLPLRPDASPIELEIEGDGWRQSSPFRLIAAPRALIESIHAAAHATGWRVAEIVGAEAAWAASASSLLPGPAANDRLLAVCLDDRVEIVRARRGHILSMRRFPPAAPGVVPALLAPQHSAPADTGEGRPAIAVIGDSAAAAQLRAGLLARGLSPARQGGTHPAPAVLAAAFAPRAAGPVLLPESDRLAMQRRAKRSSVARLAAAAALLVAAAGLQLWGASREEARIAAERARVREQVTRALATRDSLTQAVDRLTVLRSAGTGAPRWSSLIASLSATLPDDAFLLSLSAGGDTLHLEGSATRAATVFDALGTLRGIRSVRPEGPIRQEMMEDGTATERFTLAAQLEKAP